MIEPPQELWHPSPMRRLTAARDLSVEQISKLQENLAHDAPMHPWPFGMATVGNPYIVFLGPSPGNSPSPEDAGSPPKPEALPTFGEPHPKMNYKDTAGFWDKIRKATKILISSVEPAIPEGDPISLMGKLNLGVGKSGVANAGVIEDVYLDWTPRVIVQRLKPMLLVILGMKGILKKTPTIRKPLSTTLGIDLAEPENNEKFLYRSQDGAPRRLTFDLWAPTWNGHKPIVVQWPNHPVRAPFTNPEKWEDSWRQFCALDYVKSRLENHSDI